MHLSHATAAYLCPHASTLQPSASRLPSAVLENVQEVSRRPCPLRLEHQAARQLGPAFAYRRVTLCVEDGRMEHYRDVTEALLLLDQGRAVTRPVGYRSMYHLDTITQVLLGHMEGQRLPSVRNRRHCALFFTGWMGVTKRLCNSLRTTPLWRWPNNRTAKAIACCIWPFAKI